ncbi:MAG: LL-diaminopimelate aminotransferase [Candidatus Glassbacteria bacterium]
MDIKYSKRLSMIPAYIFQRLSEMKEAQLQLGKDIIDLGIGDPDLPTPRRIIERLKAESEKPENHHYPPYAGIRPFKDAIARWYKGRFGIDIDADKEVIVLIGSKEGIAHIFLSFIDPGDVALCPNPSYPVYSPATVFAGGTPFYVPLREENNFLPDISSIPKEIARRARLFIINYPNNPTAAVIDKESLELIVSFCRSNEIILCQDAAYSMLTFDGYEYPALFSIDGAREVGVEFHSLSKTFNMTGWRVGFAVGREEILRGLLRIKSNMDSGVFPAIQQAGVEALENCQTDVAKNVRVFARRRDRVVNELKKLGWNVRKPYGTFYLWLRTPGRVSSMEFTKEVLERCGILLTPGIGFGEEGEGYIRIALTLEEERLEEALHRLIRL